MGKENEQVLVVRTERILPNEREGVIPFNNPKEVDDFEAKVWKYGEFRCRGEVEDDPSWQQIIPYCVFRYGEHFFLMQRTNTGGERRLHNAYTAGIGGHLNPSDLAVGPRGIDWAQREIREEVTIGNSYAPIPVGLIKFNGTSVGQVHLGYIIELYGQTPKININSELKSGELVSFHEFRKRYSHVEDEWTNLTIDYLAARYMRNSAKWNDVYSGSRALPTKASLIGYINEL